MISYSTSRNHLDKPQGKVPSPSKASFLTGRDLIPISSDDDSHVPKLQAPQAPRRLFHQLKRKLSYPQVVQMRTNSTLQRPILPALHPEERKKLYFLVAQSATP